MTDQPALSPAASATLLAFADDEHMVGARHTNWIGLGPFLEEDLTFCSIAQDELGHAIALYERILGIGTGVGHGLSDDRELDAFALVRDPADYRSCWLAEAECSKWNDALVRHWLYDLGEQLRWESLAEASDPTLRNIAVRAEREEAFHRLHAGEFMTRMSLDETSGRAKIEQSLAYLLPLAVGMWKPVAEEAEAIAEGFVAESSADLGRRWTERVNSELEAWGFDIVVPTDGPPQASRTVRSDGFDSFLAGLQAVITIDPTAVW